MAGAGYRSLQEILARIGLIWIGGTFGCFDCRRCSMASFARELVGEVPFRSCWAALASQGRETRIRQIIARRIINSPPDFAALKSDPKLNGEDSIFFVKGQ